MDVLKLWQRFYSLPFGDRLFSRFLGRFIPYSGSLGFRVLRLEPGQAMVRITERRALSNHLDSLHAAALMNVGELSSGLALFSALPTTHRGILVHFEIDFFKKSRGAVLALSQITLSPEDLEKEVFELKVPFRIVLQESEFSVKDFSAPDAGADLVRGEALWRIQRKKQQSAGKGQK